MPVNTAVVSLNVDSPEVCLFSNDYPLTGLDIQAAAVSPDTPKLLFSQKRSRLQFGSVTEIHRNFAEERGVSR
jgi:hypothetical protein